MDSLPDELILVILDHAQIGGLARWVCRRWYHLVPERRIVIESTITTRALTLWAYKHRKLEYENTCWSERLLCKCARFALIQETQSLLNTGTPVPPDFLDRVCESRSDELLAWVEQDPHRTHLTSNVCHSLARVGHPLRLLDRMLGTYDVNKDMVCITDTTYLCDIVQCAIECAQLGVLQMLCKHGFADLDAYGSVMSYAVACGNVSIVALLHDHDTSYDPDTLFREAHEWDHTDPLSVPMLNYLAHNMGCTLTRSHCGTAVLDKECTAWFDANTPNNE